MAARIGVSAMMPGHTALTRTPLAATSAAKHCVKPMIANLEAA
jgi:hypothetical protein